MQPVLSSLEEGAQTSHPASNFTLYSVTCPLQKEEEGKKKDKIPQLHREGPKKLLACKHKPRQEPAGQLQFSASIWNRGWKCLFLNILPQCFFSLSLFPRRQTSEGLIWVTGWQFVKTGCGTRLGCFFVCFFSAFVLILKAVFMTRTLSWIQKDVSSSELGHVPPLTAWQSQKLLSWSDDWLFCFASSKSDSGSRWIRGSPLGVICSSSRTICSVCSLK